MDGKEILDEMERSIKKVEILAKQIIHEADRLEGLRISLLDLDRMTPVNIRETGFVR